MRFSYSVNARGIGRSYLDPALDEIALIVDIDIGIRQVRDQVNQGRHYIVEAQPPCRDFRSKIRAETFNGSALQYHCGRNVHRFRQAANFFQLAGTVGADATSGRACQCVGSFGIGETVTASTDERGVTLRLKCYGPYIE